MSSYAEVLKFDKLIANIFTKFFKSSSVIEIDSPTITTALFYFIRIYLLNIYEENDNCMRIILFLTNILISKLSED